MELVITQLTDIHIKQEEDLNVLVDRTSSIVGAIAEVIRKPEDTMLLICVTGDIAHSGTVEQYDMAELFFDDIYQKLIERYNKLDVHFSFVPGNHDCDFTDSKNNVRNTILNVEELDMDDSGIIETCTCIQKNYFDFVDRYVEKGLASPNRKNNIFTQNEIINEALGKYRIKLHCLNTAWCSVLHEKKDMRFSVPKDIEEKSAEDIVITLMHHGSNWFDWKGSEIWEEYHKHYSDIILIGHDHYTNFVHSTNYDNASNYFIKGNQLYSTEDAEKSAFNILKVNLDDEMEIFYTYSLKEKTYERIIATQPQKFEKNKFLNSKVGLTKELKEYLEDIEIDISSKYKSPLLLSDIFVFPALRGKRIDNPEKYSTYRDREAILEVIQNKKKIFIKGNKEYGKTALLKSLFINFYDEGCFPIILDIKDIHSAEELAINDLIRKTYKSTYYNLNVDEVLHAEQNKRVCLVDNFDDIKITDKSQKQLLEYINNLFDIVILTVNNKNNMLDTVRNLETNEYIGDEFYEMEIRALRRYGKNRIIDRWLLLEDSEQDINSQEFDTKRKNKMAQMQGVLKTGYFSNTPLEFLLVLSYIENSEMMNTDYSRYSYIYDCLIREKINEISNKETQTALAYKTLLEILAYQLYINHETSIFEEKYLLTAIAIYNENYPPLKGNAVKIIQKLIHHKILEERNDKYKFKYNYMYYYFAGSYIVDVLSPQEKEEKIKEILSDLSFETNYNIALFIAYSMNAQHDILPKIQSIADELLDDYKDFKFEDQRELLDKINTDVLEKLDEMYKIPDNKNIPEIQQSKQIAQDEYEEKRLEEQNQKETEEGLEVIFTDFSKLFRLIEFQGDVLKNYATKIQNKPRMEIIELMGSSNLKLLGFLCNMVSSEIDRIIELVEKKAKESDNEDSIAKDMLLALIKDFLSVIWAQFIELNVDFLSMCWECDLLVDDIAAYKEKMKSEFFDMVNVEYKIRISDGKLPISDIERCLSGKRKLSSFTTRIMKNIIASYLTTYQYDIIDKQRVCTLLDYKYDYVEEQKQKALGLTE